MMRGRLVVAANIGGLGEVVGDAGIKVAAGDPVSLTDSLRRVLDDASLVPALGRKARERASRLFRQDRMIDDHWRTWSLVARSLFE